VGCYEFGGVVVVYCGYSVFDWCVGFGFSVGCCDGVLLLAIYFMGWWVLGGVLIVCYGCVVFGSSVCLYFIRVGFCGVLDGV